MQINCDENTQLTNSMKGKGKGKEGYGKCTTTVDVTFVCTADVSGWKRGTGMWVWPVNWISGLFNLI